MADILMTCECVRACARLLKQLSRERVLSYCTFYVLLLTLVCAHAPHFIVFSSLTLMQMHVCAYRETFVNKNARALAKKRVCVTLLLLPLSFSPPPRYFTCSLRWRSGGAAWQFSVSRRAFILRVFFL